MASEKPHRAAVIGGGVAGLAAIKNCLEEGLQPTCFEQYDDIGGVWNYSPKRRPHEGAAGFQNLITNTSRETTSFTDFPIPLEYPLYIPHHMFLEYLKAYADHFKLWPHIQFNSRVVCVLPADDYASTGQWQVTVECDGRQETQEFQSVLVCRGMQVDPFYPDLPGKFQGEIIHMAEYRSPEVFAGKRVLVIGNQHSAGDAVCDAASCCTQAYLSPGRGGMMMTSRLTPSGQSAEVTSLTRLITRLVSPPTLGRLFRARAAQYMDYAKLGLKMGDNPLTKGVTMINEDLRYRLMTGTVKAVGAVTSYTATGVQLEDGSHLEIDMILFATGYKSNYDFIEVPGIKGHDFRLRSKRPLHLYKWVFPVDLPHPTLSLVDAYNVYGSHVGALEMRSRWVAAVLAGRCSLPSNAAMRAHQGKQYSYMEDVCDGKVKITWYDMCDDMAREIGAYPGFWRLFCHNPAMAVKVYLGPLLPQHYRLVGPRASAVAWQHCNDVYHHMYPLKHRMQRLRSFLLPAALVAGVGYVLHRYDAIAWIS